MSPSLIQLQVQNGYAQEPPQELGLLAGGAMRVLWQKALRTQSADPVLRERARADVEWWSEYVIRAQRWLC